MNWFRTYRRLLASISWVSSLTLAMAPAVASAEEPTIVIDNRTEPAAPAPTLDRTQNGVEQLNIATPNGAGLSHNMFTQYNVEQKGLILNNATQATQTQLGGYIYGNANLNGHSAHVILNEVTGTQASQMNGFTEVAGAKANVVIANPNGITCNGCGFINIDRATLSTGHPEFNAAGGLAALTVSDGLIAFEGKGGNFTAVPVLDIISRRVALNAQVNAQTANLVVGRNRVDYNTGNVTKLASDGSKTPEFAIDSSAMGGMYANRISMLVNETGAGVRVNGAMAANAGDMALTADGRLVLNGSMTATGNVTVQTNGVTNTGTLQAGGVASIASASDVTNQGTVGAGDHLGVSADTLNNTGAMTAAGSSGVALAVTHGLSNAGQISATSGTTLASAGTVSNAGSGIIVGQAGVALTTAGNLINAGEIGTVAGPLTIRAQSIANTAGQILSQNRDIALETGSLSNTGAGQIQAGGNLTAQVTSYTADAGSTLQAGASLAMAVTGGAISNDGRLSAGNALSLSADQGIVNGGNGVIAADNGMVAITTGTAGLNNAGQIGTATSGDVAIAGGALVNSGTLAAAGDAILTTGALTNSGSLTAAGTSGLVLSVSDLANTGSIGATAGTLAVTATDGLTNSGTLYGAAADSVTTSGALDNQNGQIGAGTSSLMVQAATLANDSGKIISTSGPVTIQAGTIGNRNGAIQGQGDVTITTPTLDNRNGGLIQSTGAGLYLANGDQPMTTLYNQGGSLGAAGTLSLNTSNYETDSKSALVSTGVLTLKMAGTLSNGGQLVGQKGFNLTVGSFTNEASGILAAVTGNGSLTTTGTGQLVNAGAIETLQAGSTLEVRTATGGLSNTGAILGSGTATIVSTGLVANSGKISALGGALTLQAAALTNTDTLAAKELLTALVSGDLTNSGTLYGATGGNISATGALANKGTTAQIAADGALSLSAGTLTNSNGQILASQDGLIVAANTVTNSGGLLQGDTATNIRADTLTNMAGGAILSKSGAMTVGGQSATAAQSVSNLTGTLQAATDLSVTANAIDNSGGTFNAQAGALTASSGTGLFRNDDGIVQSATGMTLSGDSFTGNTGSIVNAGTILGLNFGSSLDTAGHIVATQDLAVQTGALTTHAGTTPSTVAVVASTGGNLTVRAGTINNAGVLETTGANGTLTVQGADLTNTGTLTTASTLSVTETGQMVSSGSLISSKGQAILTAGSLTNSGFVGAAQELDITASQTLTNSGTLYGGTTLTATGTGSFDNAGGQIGTGQSVTGQGALTLASNGAFSNENGQIVAAGGPLAITAGSIAGSAGSLLQSSDAVTLTAGQISNDNSTILAKGGDITLAGAGNSAANLSNVNGGVIQASRAISATFSALDNSGGTVSALGGDLSLNGVSGSSVTNAGGTLETANNLTLTAGFYSGAGTSRLTTEQTMTLSLSGSMENGGNVAAVRDLSVTASSFTNDANAVLASTSGNLVLAIGGDAGLVNAGTIQTSGVGNALTLNALSIDNQATGAILSNGAQTLVAGSRTRSLTAGTFSNEGQVIAYGNSLTATATALNNSGTLEAGTNTSLTTTGDVANTGLIYAAGGTAIGGANVYNAGGQIGAGSGSLTVSTGMLDNTDNGRIAATSGMMALTADTLDNAGGLIDSAGDLTVLTGSLDNGSGKILSDHGNLLIDATADGAALSSVNNSFGLLQAGRDQTLRTATLTNSNGQIITVSGNLTLMGGPGMTALQSVDDTNGVLQSGQDLTLAVNSLTGASGLSATRDLSFSTAQSVSGAMMFSAGHNAMLAIGGDYSIAAGSGVIAGGDATVSAASVTNAGAMMAGGTLSVSTPGALYNTGLIDGVGGVSLALDGALTNLEAAILSDNGSISIGGKSGAYAGDVLNRSAEILAGSANGDVTIHAASLTNDIDGGVTQSTITQMVYDHTYTLAQDQLANPPALNPAWRDAYGNNVYDEVQPYYKEVMRIYVPELFYSADGKPGQGYYLVVMSKGAENSSVEVQGLETQTATASNASSLIDAGGTLSIDTLGAITNDASHLAAGGDINLTGASLSNTGYDSSITWTIIADTKLGKRWVPPGDKNAVINPDPDAMSAAPMPSFMPNGHVVRLWGTSVVPALNATIVAGGNMNGAFTGQVNNTTVIEHASSTQLAANDQYAGTMPGGISGSATTVTPGTGGSVAPSSSQDGFADASTAVAGGVTGSTAINGDAINNGGTGTGTQAADTTSSRTATLPSYGGVLAPAGHESGAAAGQSLVLPGFISTSTPTVSQLIASVPGGKALYVPDTSPTANYLIETNPSYTSLNAFHGSEYLLDRLGDDYKTYTFLGDATFDQQYVQQQIVSATGQTYLGGTYTTASSQMEALLNDAADQASSLGLTLGAALTDAQKAKLTSDIVWYVNKVVDGRTVLVPELYLAPGHEALTGATISATDVSVTAGSLTNSGTINAKNALSLTTTDGDLTNSGTLSGGTVSLVARNGSVVNSDMLDTYLVQGGTQQILASTGAITATGSATIVAAKDITFNGGTLTSGGDLNLLAGSGLTLGTTELTQAAAVSTKHLSTSGSADINYGTTVSVGGNATLAALGGDLKTAALTLTADGDVSLSAAKTLDLGSATDSVSNSISGSKSGFMTHSRFSNSLGTTTENGSSVAAGGSLTATSGGDMSVAGMAGAAGDVTLLSGGAFTERATQSTLEASASHHVAGFHMSTQGASGTVGYGSRTDKSSVSETQWTPSVIASTGGNTAIVSTGALTIDGSAVSAAKDLALSGSSVAFKAEQNSTTQNQSHKSTSIGVTAGVSPDSMVGEAIDGLLSASKSGNGTLAALGGIQTGMTEGMSALGGAIDNNLVGVGVSVGFSTSKSHSTDTQTTVQGTTASAGGTLSVVARGDNATDTSNGNLSAVAAQLAGQDVVLAASKGIDLSAGWNTTHSESRSKSLSASVGVEASVGMTGAGISVTASVGAQKQHTTSDSATAVDTSVSAANGVTVATSGALTLNGAEVSGQRVDVAAGSLSITSPQNTSSYKSVSESGGLSVAIPVYGTGGSLGGSANVSASTITDHYVSTGSALSGLYAGTGGLGVDVTGNTSLTAGVLSSTADAGLNHFSTGSLTATSEGNVSRWSGTGTSIGGGVAASGGEVGGLGTVGVGATSSERTSESLSAIGGNIAVNAGSVSGTYTTDVASANGHLANDFSAAKVSNTLQTEIGAETAAESAAELGVQAADRFGSQGEGASDTSGSGTGKSGQDGAQDASARDSTVDGAATGVGASGSDGAGGDFSRAMPIDTGDTPSVSGGPVSDSVAVRSMDNRTGDETITVTVTVTATRHTPAPGIDFSRGNADADTLATLLVPPYASAKEGLAAAQDFSSGHYLSGVGHTVLAVGGVMPGESTLASVGAEAEAVATTGGRAVAAAQHGEQDAAATVHMAQGAEDAAQVGQSIAINKSSGADSAANAANSVRLNDQLAAEEIANGHAFDKHVIDQNEFGGAITTKQQFADQIENILNNPSATKQLSNGRTAYWDNSSGMVVIRNPKAADGGTAFKPTNGKAYFNNLR
ncbi:two-partner secretion domain-containing protein [Acetobacter sp.]|jgi:filamentous hemagglutinin|uniref:two-partner secretion domain-containing protein n=1 Tax=Acetobacter sp. TaxID=440 RepID=UPI0025B8CCDE|nr:hemagglutinin repeat-containing protein [Acetobacter sp.]MCH4091118.1 hemagglutinin repeat-containing protein [Acetobacter sp.]MCI1300301.1 hemagglutinin repeat-containing protein [Acetobacter sp.]